MKNYIYMKKLSIRRIFSAFVLLAFILSSVNTLAGDRNGRSRTAEFVQNKFANGRYHNMEIRNGVLWAWGQNNRGQLGDGTTTNRTSPVQVITIHNRNGTIQQIADEDWVSVSVGDSHSLALKSDGTMWIWGGNYGRNPIQINIDDDWVAITTGYEHSVALKSNGTLWHWGGSYAGTFPSQINAWRDWISISANDDHTMGLRADGSIWGWGGNAGSQLGDGTNTNRGIPVQAGTSKDYVSVNAGRHHTMAIKKDGTLWAWGLNNSGQLGIGVSGTKQSPVQVGTDDDWLIVAGGAAHSAAIKSDGTLWTWGLNPSGQLGNGTTTNSNTPAKVGTAKDWVAVKNSFSSNLAIKANGTLWFWGNSPYTSSTSPIPSPTQIGTAPTDWIEVQSGHFYGLGIKADGSLWAWGQNLFGQLGDNSTTNRHDPVRIGTANDWVKVATGRYHSVGLKADGTLWAWGQNTSGQLGDGTTTNRKTPIKIGTNTDWVNIAAGVNHTLAIKSDGTLWAWGNNSGGKLGDGTSTGRIAPVQAGTSKDWVALSAGNDHSLAIKANGQLWAWGGNGSSQLGDGSTTPSNVPKRITNAAIWTSIDAALEHSVALKSDGTLWVWGNNAQGQLGDGTTQTRTTPRQIISGTPANDWVDISSTFRHGAAKKGDGTIWSWGQNGDGQLGDGTTTNRLSPVQSGNADGWAHLTTGYSHTLFVKPARAQICASGRNNYGQLGNGTTTSLSGIDCSCIDTVKITTQPSSINICKGSNATFFTTTSGNVTTYQWQVNTGSGWTDISNNATYSGADSDSLTISAATVGMSGYQYRLFVKGTCILTATSSVATLTLIDSIPPVVTAPGNITMNVDAGTCIATNVSLGTATTSDNCGIDSVWNIAPASYPVGTTSVIWTAKDVYGNISTDTQTVTVIDNILPTISAPSNVFLNIDTVNFCSVSTASLGTPTTSDNCGVDTVWNNAPASFPIGQTTVTWTVRDVNGNTATATHNVYVRSPEIELRGANAIITNNNNTPISANNTLFGTSLVAGTTYTKTYQIRNDGVSTLHVFSVDIVDDNGNNFTLLPIAQPFTLLQARSKDITVAFTGNQVGTYTARVKINSNDCDESTHLFLMEAVINCGPAPFTTCPSNITTFTDSGQCSKTVSYTTATAGSNISYVFTGATIGSGSGNGSGSAFNSGITNVYVITTNACNVDTCNFTITVTDTVAPAISVSNVSLNIDTNYCFVSKQRLPSPTVTDNCSVDSIWNDAPALLPIGNNTVTWTAKDIHGNTSTATHNVQVKAPNIKVTGNGNFGNNLCSGQSIVKDFTIDNIGNASLRISNIEIVDDANGNFTYLSAVEINGFSTRNIALPHNLRTSPVVRFSVRFRSTQVGTTTAKIKITTNDCDQSVYLFPISGTVGAPQFTACPANITAIAGSGQCTAAILYTATASNADNYTYSFTGATTGSGTGTGSGATFNSGITNVRVVAYRTCSGGTDTCNFTVTLNDNQAPSVTAPGAVTVNADSAQCTATNVTLGTPTTSDNCGIATITNNAPSSYPVGETIVIWTVTDIHGNTNTATQKVTVTDNQPPSIIAPPTVSFSRDSVGCDALDLATLLGTPTVSDNCGIDSVWYSTAPPQNYQPGNNTVFWTVKDIHGNFAYAVQYVHVIAPRISVKYNQFFIPNNSIPVVIIGTDLGNSLIANQLYQKEYRINNTGNDTLHVSNVEIIDDADSSFSLVGSATFLIPPNSDTGITVAFTGSQFKTYTGKVKITSNDCNLSTHTFNLRAKIICTPPQFTTCPSGVTANADSGQCSASAAYTTAISGEGDYTYQFSGATTSSGAGTGSGSIFNVGVTDVALIVTNSCGADTCYFTVTVIDNQKPSISVAATMIVNADSGLCSATNVSLSTPAISDNCEVDSVWNNAPLSYPVGTTTVVWTVSDVHGNTNTAAQDVIVIDTHPPVIVCAAGITVNADSGVCVATNVSLATPFVTDNCGVDSVWNNAPVSYAVGATMVTWTAMDIHGNSSTCTQSVTVVDNQPPVITAPATVNINADNGVCGAAKTSLPAPTTSDNCGVDSVWNNAPATLNVGTTTVTWTVADVNGNTSTTTQNITVIDNQSPIINVNVASNTLPAQQLFIVVTPEEGCLTKQTIVPTNLGGGTLDSLLNANAGFVTVNDNCSIQSIWNTAPDTFNTGQIAIRWFANDYANNVNGPTNAFTFNYLPKEIEVRGNNNVINDGDNTPSTNDNTDFGTINTGDSVIRSFVVRNNGLSVQGAPTLNRLKINSVTITGANASDFTILNGLPAYIAAGAQHTLTVVFNGNALGTKTAELVINNEDCDEGSYTFALKADVTCIPVQFTSCPSNITLNTANGQCSNATVYTTNVSGLPNPNLTYTFTGATIRSGSGSGSGAGFNTGVTNVQVIATNLCSADTCNFTVTVVDNQNPTITAPNAVTVNADNGVCTATNVTLGSPITSDNCGVASTTNNAPSSFPVGTTTVIWTVTDVNGNTTTATQDVTVIDNQNPTITAPNAVMVNADNDLCSASNVTLGTSITADNCGVDSVWNNAPATYPVGITTVTWTVIDIHGNSATATQDVTVVDNQAPVAVCKNYTVTLSNGSATITPSDINNGSTDNCGIDSMIVSKSTFTCSDAGANTVVLTVYDIHGNSATCTATVTVPAAPSVSITTTPSNNTYTGGNPNNIYLGYGPQSATITATGANGGGFTYSWSPAAGLSCSNCQSPVFTPTAAGNYTYTVTATNEGGCSSISTVSFCVLDAQQYKNNGSLSGKINVCITKNNGSTQTKAVQPHKVASYLQSGARLGRCDESCGAAAKGGRNTVDNETEQYGLEDLAIEKNIKVYPNPNNGTFIVEIPESAKGGKLQIIDMMGKIVKRVDNIRDTKLQTSMNEVADGVYMVELMNETESFRVRVVIKR